MIELAHPDDPDVDFDLDALVLTSVVRMGVEVFVSGTGGIGRWEEGAERVDVWDVPQFHMVFRMPLEEEDLESYTACLSHWVAEGTMLRMVAAPGRWSRLMEDTDRFLPVPRLEIRQGQS